MRTERGGKLTKITQPGRDGTCFIPGSSLCFGSCRCLNDGGGWMEYMLIKWGMPFWMWCIFGMGIKGCAVGPSCSWVQCQANTRYWPGGWINVQHLKLLAPLHAPAPACPHEARSGNSQVINRYSIIGAFYVGWRWGDISPSWNS